MTTVRFDGGDSFDPHDTINAYAWTFGDGGSASGSVVSHAYTTPGTFQVQATVIDATAGSKTASIQVTVN